MEECTPSAATTMSKAREPPRSKVTATSSGPWASEAIESLKRYSIPSPPAASRTEDRSSRRISTSGLSSRPPLAVRSVVLNSSFPSPSTVADGGEAGRCCDRLAWDDDGHLLMLMPGVDEHTARDDLQKFANAVAGTRSSSPMRTYG
ncbi:hypothetical protein SANTM175S_06381 [Streptomyces antimycoticus]